jgi:hypothetical protein
MEQEEVRVGQRIRVRLPGLGDHGQVGTVMKVRNGKCYIRLDWDQRLQHLVMFFPQDLVPDEPNPPLT